ncbi:MAG: UDP-N-acetylmuramoyl-L-alanine--D-glutamate ligase [Pseudomonadota bacterium]|nr:UDP-N-acetylmuramoyl-L-alanine--D-glutamate ligase [Pseudomonadota bacterium]
MITSTAFAGKHYAVLGLARSGLATVEALLASGARVTAWDSNQETIEKFRSSQAKSRDAGASVSTQFIQSNAAGGVERLDTNGLVFLDLDTADLTQFDSIIVTPGLPLNRHPIAQRAADAGVEIIGDIELFARARAELPPHKVVGITGTNGKSTTTALVHHILQTAGVPSLMGGNIGLPILAQDPLPEGGVYVLELSSYQLDLTETLDCDVAVLLNITPDHLDRYDEFEAYAASKMRIFGMQTFPHRAVVTSEAWRQPVVDRKWFTSLRLDRVSAADWDEPGLLGSAVYDGTAYLDGEAIACQRDWPTLQGPHNAQNVAAALAVCEKLDLNDDVVAKALQTYPGLPHRMERVHEKGGVQFVNDSKATNPTATAPALAAFPAIRWILGGQAKSDNLDECAPHFGNVRKAYTIGEAGEMFASLLSPHMAVARCGTLEAAVTAAAANAREGETVLLSPACASFDQFRDFEARGEAFRAAVEAL